MLTLFETPPKELRCLKRKLCGLLAGLQCVLIDGLHLHPSARSVLIASISAAYNTMSQGHIRCHFWENRFSYCHIAY